MENAIILIVLIVIIGLAAGYVIISKKNGKKCIGCPDCSNCSKNCENCSSQRE